ncbi:hypothetical protein CL614_07830 [archaeon]|nr:hypothetical protein [archaeon]
MTVAAVGGQNPDPTGAGELFEDFKSGVDIATAGALAGSGNFNNLNDSTGTVIVFPETMHNDPQYGHIIHFDIYNKKRPAIFKDTTTTTSSGEVATAKQQIQATSVDISAGSREQMLQQIDQATRPLASVLQSEVTSTERIGQATEESLDKITLYMPKGIRNADSINYSDVDFGLIKGAMEGNVAALVPGLAQKMAGFVDGLAEITSTELNTAQAMSSWSGAYRNPRKEQLFEGVGLRNFDFTFNLFPKSEKESLDVMRMIKLFRFHAYPEIVPNMAFFRVPSEFQITYIDLKYPTSNPLQDVFGGGDDNITAKENAWLHKIARCALTNVTTEYFPMDSLSTFRTGAPTMVNLSLTFTELEVISRNHVRAGY